MLTPSVQTSLDGVGDITAQVGPRTLSCTITEHDTDKADRLHLVVSNFDGKLAKPARGAVLTVAMGFVETGTQAIGQFKVQTVTKHGPVATFDIVAESANLATSLKQQKTRSWVNQPLSAALNQIAGDNGLNPAIDGDLGSTQGSWYQSGESDMHFVTRLARRFGAVGKIAEGNLVFIKRGAGETASGLTMTAITITPNDLEQGFAITDTERPSRKNSKGKHYDRKTAKRAVVNQASQASGDGPDYTFPHLFANPDEAQKSVAGRQREFDRSTKSFSGTLRTGLNTMKAGGVLTTSGFGDDDDMDWTLEEVEHHADEHGYVTKFKAKKKVAAAGSSGGGGGATTAPTTGTGSGAGSTPVLA